VDLKATTAGPAARAGRAASVIGVASGIGAPDRRCGEGPPRLIAGGLLERLTARGADVVFQAILRPHYLTLYRAVSDLSLRLAREVSAVLESGRFPLVLGGDHSCAIGTWSGVASALAARGPLGLVWIDAHMDSHTRATSWTGMPHGMPLAALLGYGEAKAVSAQVASTVTEGHLDPRHVSLVGIRSYEPEEAALLDRLGVRVFEQRQVDARGMHTVLGEAVAIARAETSGYGISLDLDALDPHEAPGVGTPVAGGIPAGPLTAALAACCGDEKLVALEIVEYNPHRDRHGRTARLVENLIAAVLNPVTGSNR
jgi:arginase